MVNVVETQTANRTCTPIFVRATGAGAGGIAVLILDGAGARGFLTPYFKSKRSLFSATTGDLLFGRLVDGAKNIIDEVVVAPLSKKDSETGNEQIEISCHGGEGAVAAVEELLVEAGFARGGSAELLKRAHLNCNLSLIAIEARLRLASVATERQAELLLSHAQLQQRWERLGLEMGLGMRSGDSSWRAKTFDAAVEGVAHYEFARRLLAQHCVAVIGPVNAGKSTLCNRLARAERHIVSAIPGTTRDRLETPIDLRGMNVLLTDTAGFRTDPSPYPLPQGERKNNSVESEGQRRAGQAAREAELRLVVLDGSRSPTDEDVELLKHCAASGRMMLALNKKDLGLDESTAGLGFLAGCEPCAVSAKTGAGIEELGAELERLLLNCGAGVPPASAQAGCLHHNAPFTERQARRLEQIKQALKEGQPGADVLVYIRKLVGTRPNREELAEVLK